MVERWKEKRERKREKKREKEPNPGSVRHGEGGVTAA